MKNFGALYRYECKKLFYKKIVWISLALSIVIIIVSLLVPLFGDYYVDGKFVDTNYNMFQTDKRYAEALNGREINKNLLDETITAYSKIPEIQGKHYALTEEYQQYARPYSEIFNFIRQMTGMQTSELLSWQPSEEGLYTKRAIFLTALWEDLKLSKGETDFWRKQEARIKKPYIYQSNDGYSALLSSYQTVGIFVLMLIAICLSGMFSDEHTRNTDQIILCSSLGKTRLYWAKVAAGVSFAALITALFFAVTFATTLCVYGTAGFRAAFQLIYARSSDPITCGQALFIAYGNMMFAAIVISMFVMLLSEVLCSNIGALAVSSGLLIMAMMVSVPEQYRTLAQIWDWLPWSFLAPWNVFGQYTLCIFGHYLTPWQAVPVIYLILSALLAFAGRPIYRRFEISGK